ncbi:MAG: hypothetical protein OEM07_05670 [Gammaproteobacteria bacterium]|nr:hypothetical protein [Gammaproteobacteria bacterium]
MSYDTEERRGEAGLPPTTLTEMLIKYGFWTVVGSMLLYFFDINVFQWLGF